MNTNLNRLKSHFRMGQNYLHGEKSPQINAFLAAAGWNMKMMMRKLKKEMGKTLWAFIYRLFFQQLIPKY